MTYPFDGLWAIDPLNPTNVAQNAEITIHAVGDGTRTPLDLTDNGGSPTPNPVYTNEDGFVGSFRAAVPRVAWYGGNAEGSITSWEGLKEDTETAATAAQAAQQAAESAGATAVQQVETELTIYRDAVTTSATDANTAAQAATAAAALVDAPAGEAIKAALEPGGVAYPTLATTYVPLSDDGADTPATVTKRLSLEDNASAKGSALNMEHNGAGTSGTTQTYGIDLHNNLGARSAFVIHQYSKAQAAIQLDNTDTAPMIVIKNTNNTVRNPNGAGAGESATGDAFQLLNTTGQAMFKIMGRGQAYINPPAGTAGDALEINTPTSGFTGRGIRLRHNHPGNGFEILSAETASGYYPFNVTGQNYGGQIATVKDGGTAFQITKNGASYGNVLSVINKGTGQTAQFRNGADVQSAVLSNGEFEHFIAGAGIILASPDGGRFRLSVTNAGALDVSPA